MYLTRFRINTARMGARRLLTSPQALHAAVMAAFAERVAHSGQGPRVLWRIDNTADGEVLLFIVSPERPDLTHLVEQAGWPETGRWQTAPYGPFLAKLAVGETWAFRLSANPVHSIRRTPDESTKRTAHITPRHQADWLLARQEHGGFAILDRPAAQPGDLESAGYELLVHSQRELAFRKTDSSSGKRLGVKLTRVTYDGRLRVTDPDALRRTLTAGLGKGKAYGCGLMTLAPVAVAPVAVGP
ncbi:type I-E CRISPR-associated protein Cas6/Cse3/CasE [Peterkaempfera bronchialis]|uniref:type I-E CRISPR-associated protein Cas6/Cse3/CasE n=1 Tax=Peterkaempfera bronchialis TaxID=2126346 RepID=UPI003C2B347A